MRNRLLSTLLALCMMLSLLPGTAQAVETSGTCGDNLTWSLSEGTLTIQGTGPMEDYSYAASIWYNYREQIQTVNIVNGVTTIGDYAFNICRSLTSVTIPNSVTSIGEGAFCYCSSLTSVKIPDSVTRIGEQAFGYCSSLACINVATGNPAYISVDSVLFNADQTLLHTYPAGKIGTSYSVPDSVTSIGRAAFYGCGSLTSVEIPDSVISIGRAAFYRCNSLTGMTIPGRVTSIGSAAFSGCSGLASVEIPDSVTSIEELAFLDCSSLTDVYYSGSESQWKQISIGRQNDLLIDAVLHYNVPISINISSGPTTDVAESENPVLTVGVGAANGPAISGNIYKQSYLNYDASTVKSYLFENGNGGLTRVEYIPTVLEWAYHNSKWSLEKAEEKYILVEDYNSNFEVQHSRSLPMELDIWGGFFVGENYNFLVFGQENSEESNSTEVIRVVKYSKDWQRLGQASLYGANTVNPFRSGTLRAVEYDGVLYIRTCHTMYTSSDGLNHQANMTIVVREQDMTVTDSAYRVARNGTNYVSHSFNQFILIDHEQRIITLDQGDAYPRSAELAVFAAKAGTTNVTNGSSMDVTVQSFPQNSDQYQRTGASFGGIAETSSGYAVAYSYDGTGQSTTAVDRSIYFAYVDKDRLRVETKVISSTGVQTPMLAPTGLDDGYILWNASDTNGRGNDKLYYAVYSNGGNVGEIKTATAPLSDCQPILYNGKVIWYTTNDTVPTFYLLDRSGVTAVKAKEVFSVLVGGNDPDGGTVSGGNKYLEGSPVQITASPFNNYEFLGWYADGNLVSTDETYRFLAQANTLLAAKFAFVFTDVVKTDWFYDDVAYIARNGLMNGVDSREFNPSGTTTRGMIMTILARMSGVDTSGSSPWYQEGMDWAVRTSVSDGSSPEMEITREQLAIMLWRYAGEPAVTGTLSAYSDTGDIHDWANSAMIWVVQNDIMNGSDGRLNPQGNATRAEVAAVLTRFCKNNL